MGYVAGLAKSLPKMYNMHISDVIAFATLTHDDWRESGDSVLTVESGPEAKSVKWIANTESERQAKVSGAQLNSSY